MSESERAEHSSASARSTHVAHFVPAAWPDVASKLAALVARVDRAADGVQVLVLVPANSDATDLAAALQALPGAAGARIVPLAAPRRARRLAAQANAQVVVATPAAVQSLVAASALDLRGVTGLGLAAAGDFETGAAALELVLAELPRTATKVLIAAAATPFVNRLIEAHMHGARKLTHAADAAAGPEGATKGGSESGTDSDAPAAIIEVVPVSAGAPGAALADVLETVDAPSAAIVPADARRAGLTAAIVAGLGYPEGSPLARVTPTGETKGASLVVFVGAPTAAQWASTMTTRPARIVALVSSREREALAALAAVAAVIPGATGATGARLVPFPPVAARAEAASAEELVRDRLRRTIGESLPSREMLALEPLLGEFDALVLAGAALRLFEREAARRAAEPRPAAPAPSGAPNGRERPARSGDRDRPRSDDRGRPPRRDDRKPSRGDDRGRPPRSGDRDRPLGDDRGRPPRRDDRKPSRGGDRPTRFTGSPRDRR